MCKFCIPSAVLSSDGFALFDQVAKEPPLPAHSKKPLFLTMILFQSASARIVDPARAIGACLEAACGSAAQEADLIMIHAAIGHDFQLLADEAAKLAPNARTAGVSHRGGGGREGVGESTKDLAVIALKALASHQISDRGVYEPSDEQ